MRSMTANLQPAAVSVKKVVYGGRQLAINDRTTSELPGRDVAAAASDKKNCKRMVYCVQRVSYGLQILWSDRM